MNKIGDMSMGGDRILKLGAGIEDDDAATVAQVVGAAADVNALILKFSGTITQGVGAVVGYLVDWGVGAAPIPVGYQMPRAYHMTDLYVNVFSNTGNGISNVKVFKNGVATTLAISGLIAGFTGKTHLGLPANAGIAFAAEDLLDVELSIAAGAGDISITALVFGTKDQ